MWPSGHTRTSELPLPPSTGRSWIRATLRSEPGRRHRRAGARDPAAHDHQVVAARRTRAARAGRATRRRSWPRAAGSLGGGSPSPAEAAARRNGPRSRSGRAAPPGPAAPVRPRRRPASARPRLRCQTSSPAACRRQAPGTVPAPPAPSTAPPNRGCGPRRDTSGRGKLRHGDRVPHRVAQAVGQQVGRSHLVHELLVDDPAAAIVEGFGLQQHLAARLGRSATNQRACQENRETGFHNPIALSWFSKSAGNSAGSWSVSRAA